jgi:hypothetical protein
MIYLFEAEPASGFPLSAALSAPSGLAAASVAGASYAITYSVYLASVLFAMKSLSYSSNLFD